MTRFHPLAKILDRPAVQPFGDQLTLADAAHEIGFPCPSCRATFGVAHADCLTCEGLGSVGYDPADTTEFGF